MITHLESNSCLVVGRKHHNEYTNSFNDVISLLLATNHDIRFLVGGTTDAIYYVMKYVTKVPVEDGQTERILMESFERRVKVENEKTAAGLPISNVAAGRSRVNSMAMSLSRKQQIGAPICALYLRRKISLYSSHEFVALLLAQSMEIIREEDHEAELLPRSDGRIVRASQHVDYSYRPK